MYLIILCWDVYFQVKKFCVIIRIFLFLVSRRLENTCPPPQREPVCVRVLHCRQVIRATGCPKLEKKSGLKSTRPFSNRSEQTPLPKPFKDSKVYSPPALPEFTNSQKIFFYVAKLNKTLVHLAKILPQSLSLSPPLSFSLSLTLSQAL